LSHQALQVVEAADADVAGIEAVAALLDELEGGCGDPRYLAHLRRHGRVVVARRADVVVGYAASHRVGDVEMVTDLFVHPEHHGSGVGAQLLGAVWTRSDGPRMTFSSQHPHALPLYVRAGMTPRWPLLWLHGDPTALPEVALQVDASDVEEVVTVERQWVGVDRADDYRYWVHDTSGRAVVVRNSRGDVVGVGALGGGREHHGVCHFTARDDDVAAATLLAALATVAGRAFVALPGPHPAVPVLLAAGWQVSAADYWMASDDVMLDERRQALSPGLG
jgi:GNAT superfamily N-acetyltransferase